MSNILLSGIEIYQIVPNIMNMTGFDRSTPGYDRIWPLYPPGMTVFDRSTPWVWPKLTDYVLSSFCFNMLRFVQILYDCIWKHGLQPCLQCFLTLIKNNTKIYKNELKLLMIIFLNNITIHNNINNLWRCQMLYQFSNNFIFINFVNVLSNSIKYSENSKSGI